MIIDRNKTITEITYNHLNLPKKISFGTSGTIEYFYNANGEKLKKKLTSRTRVINFEYLNGFQYENGNMEFFPTAEGYVKVTETRSVGKVFSYVYNHTDHLGNIRLRYTRDPEEPGKVRILEENSYYPFGLKHEGYNGNHEIIVPPLSPFPRYPTVIIPITPFDTDPYQYKFNGKEHQDELGLDWYDYGARNYDAALGRWMNVDPLAEDYPEWSPYNYTLLNPVKLVDPDGQAPEDFTLLIAKDGAGGHGHMGAVIQDGKGNYYYVTMGAAENAGVSKMASSGVQGGMVVTSLSGAATMDEAINMAKQDANNSPYTEHITFKTTSEQDQNIYDATVEKADRINSGKENYNVLTNNCTDGCQEPIEKATGVSLPSNPIPNSNFEKVKENQTKIQNDLKKEDKVQPINKDSNPGALKPWELKY